MKMAALVITMSVSAAFAQWTENGKRVPDVSWRQQKAGFGVLLLVTDKPQQFKENWSKPTRAVPVNLPDTIKRNEPGVALVIFNGCPEDANGLCNVVASLRMVKPDGSVGVEMKDKAFWLGRPSPRPPKIERATTALGFKFDSSDPAGEYTVQVDVHDRVKGVTFALERKFRVE
jgi:hypothetical protein